MNTTKAAKSAAVMALDPFETLKSQVAKPILDEAASELGGFFGSKYSGSRPKTIAQEDLQRARDKQYIEIMKKQEDEKTHALLMEWKQEYSSYEAKVEAHDEPIRKEIVELQQEIASLAKTAGVDTKAHMENVPKKVGALDIRRLTTIVKHLRIKAEAAKSGSELVSERQSAKRTTGMLAWVSGKQMKIHEQGTLT